MFSLGVKVRFFSKSHTILLRHGGGGGGWVWLASSVPLGAFDCVLEAVPLSLTMLSAFVSTGEVFLGPGEAKLLLIGEVKCTSAQINLGSSSWISLLMYVSTSPIRPTQDPRLLNAGEIVSCSNVAMVCQK